MKNFFKPTKVMWWTFAIIIFFSTLPLTGLVTNDSILFYGVFFLTIGLAIVSGPMKNLGLTDKSAWMMPNVPNTFGFVVVFVLDVVIIYTLASIVSFLWYKFHPHPKLPEAG